MDIPVLLEPTPTGWRASTGAPLHFVAEGADRAAALADIQVQLVTKLSAGASVTSVPVPPPGPLLDMAKIRALTAELASDPFVENWARATQEYRAETNTVSDPDEPPSSPALNGTHTPPETIPTTRP